jgi:hypothetical protein
MADDQYRGSPVRGPAVHFHGLGGPGDMALDLDNLHCAVATCTRPVTHVCIQTDQWTLLFKSAAGLVCERHAEELGTMNGLSMPLEEFAKATAHG